MTKQWRISTRRKLIRQRKECNSVRCVRSVAQESSDISTTPTIAANKDTVTQTAENKDVVNS